MSLADALLPVAQAGLTASLLQQMDHLDFMAAADEIKQAAEYLKKEGAQKASGDCRKL